MPLLSVVIFSALTGLLVGSFLALLVLRLPAGRPVVVARSACPRCGHVLGPGELIPVISWLIQKRRCRACGGAISAFYPIMEISSAAITAAAAYWIPWPFFIGAWFGGWCILCLIAWGIHKATKPHL
jgi:leader peptidase (prepilin peptidase)/N-methyltransferase